MTHDNGATDKCRHCNTHFDRSICVCGWMHTYCDDCGQVLDGPCAAVKLPKPEATE